MIDRSTPQSIFGRNRAGPRLTCGLRRGAAWLVVLIGLAPLTALGESPCDAPLPPFELRFELAEDGRKRGEATATLNFDDGHWHYRISSRGRYGIVPVSFEEESIFRWVGSTPRPEHYRRESSSGPFQRLSTVNFAWNAGQADGKHRRETWKLPLNGGELDRLLMQLATATALAAGETDLDFDYVERGKRRAFHTEATAVGQTPTPAGSFTAVRVDRLRGNRATRVWHAADLHYLPVRIEHADEDERWVMELVAIDIVDCP